MHVQETENHQAPFIRYTNVFLRKTTQTFNRNYIYFQEHYYYYFQGEKICSEICSFIHSWKKSAIPDIMISWKCEIEVFLSFKYFFFPFRKFTIYKIQWKSSVVEAFKKMQFDIRIYPFFYLLGLIINLALTWN